MVEVNPGKTEIKIQSGWLIFTSVAAIIFALVFHFGAPTGTQAIIAWSLVAAALVADWWFFHAPGLMMIVLAGVLAGLAYHFHLY
ncbi:MAG TPA: hypothetical protein PLU72_03255 [Candidatus Ozemobacteraceae bacterium]|nr:hypothetical protein [Candidatus Ozemobacteraceae bacterium]HQG27456.1 hypothetical protein [Candidatus Ozemobacteraceae bacterium]